MTICFDKLIKVSFKGQFVRDFYFLHPTKIVHQFKLEKAGNGADIYFFKWGNLHWAWI